MGEPPPSKRMQRIATQLGNLSLELVEAIISPLPLYKALDLLLVPLASSESTGHLSNHGQMSPLVQAFIASPTWKHVFQTRELAQQILLVYKALNRVFKLCHGEGYSNIVKQTNFYFFPWGQVKPTWHILDQGAAHMLDGNRLLERLEATLWLMAVPKKGTGIYCNRQAQAAFMLLPSDYGALPGSPKIETPLLEAEQAPLSPVDIAFATLRPEEFQTIGWDRARLLKYIGDLEEAWKTLKESWTTELNSLTHLYERHPTMLKVALGPQLSHKPLNAGHISQKFQQATQKLIKLGLRGNGTWPWLFRFAHHCLMPYNWCLRLFIIVLNEKKPHIPPELAEDLERANQGLSHVQHHGGGGNSKYPRIQGSRDDARHVEFIVHFDERLLPAPQAELQWLTSFLAVVEWMTGEYPDLAEELRRPVARVYRAGKGRGQKRFNLEPTDYASFVEALPAQEIARYLKRDAELSAGPLNTNKAHHPSLLAFSMPDFSTQQAQNIAKFLAPQEEMSKVLQQMVYENTIDKIKQYFKRRPSSPPVSDGESLVHEVLDERRQADTHPPSQSTDWTNAVEAYAQEARKKPTSSLPRCYICHHTAANKGDFHPIFAAMCKPCGDFNLAGSRLSLPEKLDLEGKTAFVTGGRINLGFHTALRLLRCGAKVIVSSRYPHDAFVRYQNQEDSAAWIEDRLRVVGADFRTAHDAFELTRRVTDILSAWATASDSTAPQLDILINNAAQTLTDSNEKELTAVSRESTLAASLPHCASLPAATSYIPRVKGGVSATNFLEGRTRETLPSASTSSSTVQIAPEKSSWVQGLTEIPYADVVTAQAVNAFVPLILIRELLPLMSRTKEGPCGQIINVSSREGIFEDKRNHSAKQGKHVHTNMSKAALNMITETEAASSWKKHHVAMNTVDPGYMSAAPEMENLFGGVRPLGWEDGAGRVLWPVAMAYGDDRRIVWGRFLKHYGAVSVTSCLGST